MSQYRNITVKTPKTEDSNIITKDLFEGLEFKNTLRK